MKKFLLLTSLTLFAVFASAQIVTGTVREQSSNDVIPYTTISLLRTDSSLVSGTISNDNGHFQLETSAGTYILQVSYVGYSTTCRNIQIDKGKLALGDIFLSEETATIAEVEIKADKPLIQRQMDKLVMNVSDGPFSSGFSGEEILKKAPGVMVDKNGSISVNGKSVTVYIDGRPSYMNGEQLTAMLQSTDASMIDKIEVISHPSAKYDASGDGGAIINIKLKKNKMKGTNGSLSATYGGMYFKDIDKYIQNERFSLSLNHRSEHTYTAFSVRQAFGQGCSSGTSYAQQPFATDTLRTLEESRDSWSHQWYEAKISTDWYIDKKNTLGFILNVPVRVYHSTQPVEFNRSLITLGADTVQHVLMGGNCHSVSPSYTANLNYTHVFCDSLSREMTVNVDFNRNERPTERRFTYTTLANIDSIMPRMPDQLNFATKQIVDRYVAKADFQTSFWKTGTIECGAKWQLRKAYSGMQTDSIMPALTTTTLTSYNYSEHIAALYITLSKQFGEHWFTQVGLRGELTALRGVFIKGSEQKEIVQKPYFSLFPSASVGYNPTDKWTLKLSYDRSIWRPGIWYFNPFVEYSSAHAYSVGNLDIKPEYENSLEFCVGWSRYVEISFFFNHCNNSVIDRPEMLPNGDIKTTPVNFGKEITFGPFISLTEIPIVPKFKTNEQGKRELDDAWLALTVFVGLIDHISIADKTVDANYGKTNTFMTYYRGELTAYLPQDWQIGFDVFGITPITRGYYRMVWGTELNGSVRKKWPEHGVTLSLNVSDMLRTDYGATQSVGMPEGYRTESNNRYYSQQVRVSLTWNFGQNQQHKYRQVGDADTDGKKSGIGGR